MKRGSIPLLLLFILTIGVITTVGIFYRSSHLQTTGQSKFADLLTKTPPPHAELLPSTPTTSPQPLSPSPTVSPTSPSTPQPLPSPSLTTNLLKIIGNQECNRQTDDALALLQAKAPNHYNNVLKYIGTIECSAQGSGIYVWEQPPRYQAGKATRDAGTMWYAGTFAHEACHSRQYRDYLEQHPELSMTPQELWSGRNAEAECLDVQYDALTQIAADQLLLDTVKHALETEYWNVDYQNRWW